MSNHSLYHANSKSIKIIMVSDMFSIDKYIWNFCLPSQLLEYIRDLITIFHLIHFNNYVFYFGTIKFLFCSSCVWTPWFAVDNYFIVPYFFKCRELLQRVLLFRVDYFKTFYFSNTFKHDHRGFLYSELPNNEIAGFLRSSCLTNRGCGRSWGN